MLPLLLNGVEQESKYPPTLIFTGATASIKANALMSSFATGKFALRAMTSSLAKEFGPKGVHVSHAIIDGVIDLPRSKDFLKDAGPDAKISPAGVSGLVLQRQQESNKLKLVRSPTRTGVCIHSPDPPSRGKLTLGPGWRSGEETSREEHCSMM